jgi:hypothetical protein
MSNGEIILYTTADGHSRIQLRAMDGTVWLSQAEMAMLFDTTPQNITQHIKAVVEEGEQTLEATCKDFLQVQNEGDRQVQRSIRLYHLDMILAVGYRIRSPRGTQFRQWATTILREYLVKGFAMDDERLKDPKGVDYFSELLARIRDIRTSEKRFYQKVRDLFATSVDYDGKAETARLFFKTIQNKLLWAATGQTAAELILDRANPELPNMGLTSWKGVKVRKGDIAISKNYLNQEELEKLNRIVSAFLETAELRASNRQTTTMQEWQEYVDKFLTFSEMSILNHAGSVSHDQMEAIAEQRFQVFDTKRKADELLLAEAEYEQEIAEDLKRLESDVTKHLPKKPRNPKNNKKGNTK